MLEVKKKKEEGWGKRRRLWLKTKKKKQDKGISRKGAPRTGKRRGQARTSEDV